MISKCYSKNMCCESLSTVVTSSFSSTSGARPVGGAYQQVPGDWVFTHGDQSGSAQRNKMGFPSCQPNIHKRGHISWVHGAMAL